MDLNINITFPFIPCDVLSLDAEDITGVHVVNIEGRLHKHPLDKDGIKHGDFHNALDKSGEVDEEETLKRAKEGLKAGEGCEIEGTVKIHKVPGNFHISHHAYFDVMQRLLNERRKRLDFTHKINSLSFGNSKSRKVIQNRFGEDMQGELDGMQVAHGEMQAFGELSAYYHMDIAEVEFKD